MILKEPAIIGGLFFFGTICCDCSMNIIGLSVLDAGFAGIH